MSTMDFFDHQTRARRKTGLLVVFFALAVVLICATIWLAVSFAAWSAEPGLTRPPFLSWALRQPGLLLACIGGTLLVIALGTGFKTMALAGGGAAVAESLGGRKVLPGTRDLKERRLLNVVEEVAIASGTAVPEVYLLEREKGINAFAAGLSPDRAVIGVTRGCLDLLGRNELQGVVAHEFSHILNGDMRLNLKLIGVVHGILVLGVLGYLTFRGGLYAARGLRGSSSGKGSGGVAAVVIGLVLLGLLIMVVGYVGTFFGRLIKAAVSRQREFLADSSAVQFTRDPGGIGGALRKIGGFSSGSRVNHPRAEEASHMLFGQGVRMALGSLLATHPPLEERIRRIDPRFDGRFERIEPPRAAEGRGEPRFAEPGREEIAAGLAGAAAAARAGGAAPPPPLKDLVGKPAPEHLSQAAAMRRRIPKRLREAAREPWGARAVIYALLLNGEEEPRRAQLERLEAHADPAVREETGKLAPLAAGLDPALRLPLVDLAVAGLRELSPAQYAAFRENVDRLVMADRRIDLFEWVLGKVLLSRLDLLFGRAKRRPVQYYSLRRLQPELSVLLSTLVWAGASEPAAAREAFDLGARALEDVEPTLIERSGCSLDALDGALGPLAVVSPRHLRMVLNACAWCISADREVTVREAELFRAVADALGCPVPPVLPGQALI